MKEWRALSTQRNALKLREKKELWAVLPSLLGPRSSAKIFLAKFFISQKLLKRPQITACIQIRQQFLISFYAWATKLKWMRKNEEGKIPVFTLVREKKRAALLSWWTKFVWLVAGKIKKASGKKNICTFSAKHLVGICK